MLNLAVVLLGFSAFLTNFSTQRWLCIFTENACFLSLFGDYSSVSSIIFNSVIFSLWWKTHTKNMWKHAVSYRMCDWRTVHIADKKFHVDINEVLIKWVWKKQNNPLQNFTTQTYIMWEMSFKGSQNIRLLCLNWHFDTFNIFYTISLHFWHNWMILPQ